MELVSEMRAKEAAKTHNDLLADAPGNKKELVVNLKPNADGEININNWRIADAAIRKTELEESAKANNEEAEKLRGSANRKAFQPIWNKLNPLSSITGTASMITDPKGTLENHLNPLKILQNNEAVQIIRAVHGFAQDKMKARELRTLAKTALQEAAALEATPSSEIVEKAEMMADSVQKAVERESLLREKLKANEFSDTEKLDVPTRKMTAEETKEIGRIAEQTGQSGYAKAYGEEVIGNKMTADRLGETADKQEVNSFLAQARANWEAENAITGATELADGSIDVSLNPAKLESAIKVIETADIVTEFSEKRFYEAGQMSEAEIFANPEFGNKAIYNLSIEDAENAFKFIRNDNLTAQIEGRITEIGQNLMNSVQPTITQLDAIINLKDQIDNAANLTEQIAQDATNTANQSEIAVVSEMETTQPMNVEAESASESLVAETKEEMSYWRKVRNDMEIALGRPPLDQQVFVSGDDEEKEAIEEAEETEETEEAYFTDSTNFLQ